MTRAPGPFPRLRRLRRSLLARRRGIAALCVGLAAAISMQAKAAPPPPRVEVLVAAHDLPGGAPVRRADLASAAFAPDSVPDGALRRGDEAVGRLLTGPVRRGEPLTDVRLLGSGLLAARPGTVAAPVRIGDRDAVALLRVGDHVDVLAADPRSRAPAVTVAWSAVVLALPPARSQDPGQASGALVVLAVDAEVARVLAGRAVSSFLSVVLVG